jgi:hypothetical protein
MKKLTNDYIIKLHPTDRDPPEPTLSEKLINLANKILELANTVNRDVLR